MIHRTCHKTLASVKWLHKSNMMQRSVMYQNDYLKDILEILPIFFWKGRFLWEVKGCWSAFWEDNWSVSDKYSKNLCRFSSTKPRGEGPNMVDTLATGWNEFFPITANKRFLVTDINIVYLKIKYEYLVIR